ncbi:MAG: replicative DNA helicase [Oscillospiraceae bacterium]|jgi:replicative DNA helicase|nr:replicative DNA helicase [Oscillospiraceae bacterium]
MADYDGLIGRQIPHDSNAEQAVLGSMLIDHRCVPDVMGAIRAVEFYSDTNREIFETIESMFNFSLVIDPLTVLDRMKTNGVHNDNSNGYIKELLAITPTAANVMEYVKIVREKAMLRALADAGNDIASMAVDGTGGAPEILETAEKRIYALRQGRNSTGLEELGTILRGVFEQIAEAGQSGKSITGLSTGLGDLDRMIMGLNRSDLVILAARPGVGKTSLALNVALHVAKTTELSVAVFSLEMSREQLAMRLISSESFVNSRKLQTGQLSAQEWKRLSSAAEAIGAAKLLINDNPSLSVADMNAQCRRVSNLGLVVIDYLQLMQSAGGTTRYSGENRTQVVSDMSRMMKIMAKELNVPVLCLSQLSRESVKREDKKPRLADLRESGAIEQDADVVLGLYLGDEAERHNVAECIVLKNRRGETGVIELQWLPEFTTFSTIDKQHSEEDG